MALLVLRDANSHFDNYQLPQGGQGQAAQKLFCQLSGGLSQGQGGRCWGEKQREDSMGTPLGHSLSALSSSKVGAVVSPPPWNGLQAGRTSGSLATTAYTGWHTASTI